MQPVKYPVNGRVLLACAAPIRQYRAAEFGGTRIHAVYATDLHDVERYGMPGLCARQYVDVALALSIHETTEATHDTPYVGESRMLDISCAKVA